MGYDGSWSIEAARRAKAFGIDISVKKKKKSQDSPPPRVRGGDNDGREGMMKTNKREAELEADGTHSAFCVCALCTQDPENAEFWTDEKRDFVGRPNAH